VLPFVVAATKKFTVAVDASAEINVKKSNKMVLKRT
jgi:hypothetical protein